ncbi:glycosyltransferase [Candidatus Chloroploca sp. M-50]|uniref:Glycosyltransferase n=1 Tax=Candidatus Chloroploca mongolica TaxID=2528176 RepID=A0ABS4D5H8_9CHLR|nr:glycosyltransferase [Candidatus Chloroploca mongolica]MBP1464697.1 glycosyltransferase [Candidatus Chloroploca mongolica]
MSEQNPQSLYDKFYFATGCGRPYERDDHWTNFFGEIADEIVATIAPSDALDAGCALGLLVEQLRERGVAAEGIDISEFAIANAPETVKPYVRVGSVAEPFERRYDLIICIEVLEHMPKEDSERAVANFCAHSDDILFSSSPFDYKEVTHFNVNPPEYWASLFARHGFYRDVDFDASFITPWAVRFRRRNEPTARIVRDYERRFWELWKETTDLRTLNLEQRDQLRDLNALYVQAQQNYEDEQRRHYETFQRYEDEQRRHYATLQHYNEASQQNQEFDAQLRDLRQQVAALKQSKALLRQQRDLIRAMAREDLADLRTDPTLSQTQAYAHHLEAEITHRDEYIAWLESLVRAFEQGRLMSLMRRLRRSGTILPPASSPAPALPPPPPSLPEAPPAPVALPSDPASVYARWIAAHEPDAVTLIAQRQQGHHLAYRPLISMVTPVYNPAPEALKAMLASVFMQTYDRWQLCLADASTEPEVRALLQQFASTDPRVRLTTLEQNAGISANSNAALALATGEFVLLLDHDDTLAPEALFQVVQTLNAHPEADIVYYDEDKLSEDATTRHSPWFKPSAWSPDLLLSTNYLMHGVFRRSLVEESGRFNPATDGAQDWDLALRCSERTRAIYHLPRVLYHWRQMPGSASRDANAKPWALVGQERALRDHLARGLGSSAEVVRLNVSDLRVLWPVSDKLVSIIIPNRDRYELLHACLSSIFAATTYPNYEVIIVDNGSVDGRTLAYYEQLKADGRVRVVPLAEAFNWSRANNLGVAEARGDLLLFLNNDTEVRAGDWLHELVGWAERPEVGVVGCKLIRPDGTTQHAGIAIGVEGHGSHLFDGDVTPTYGPFGSSEWYRDLLALTGACMMMRRDVFEAIGGFDERYRVGYSDLTFCLAAHQHGLRVVYTPHASLLHHEGASRGFALPFADILRATLEMLPHILAGDPYFSPHLSPVQRRPAIADPAGEKIIERMALLVSTFHLTKTYDPAQLAAVAEQLLKPRLPAQPVGSSAPRLLVCSHELSFTGAPLILFQLAQHFAAQGYEVTMASVKPGPLGAVVEAAGIPVEVNPLLYDDALVAATLVRDYDLVLVNTILGYRVILAAHVMEVPSAWWIHESRSGYALMESEAAPREALSLADRLIFPAAATAALYRGFTSRQLPTPLPYGVPDLPFEPDRPRDPEEPLMVLVIASMETRKGQDLVVKAFQQLPPALRAQFELYFIGGIHDPHYYRQVRADLAAEPNVYFIGLLNRDQTLTYLRQADIFVLPSRDEVLPVSILEAMACGKAMVVTDVGGVTEAVRHEQEGLVVPPDDPDQLAESLARLISAPELRQRLGRAARVRYEERFTAATFAQAMDALVRDLLPPERALPAGEDADAETQVPQE